MDESDPYYIAVKKRFWRWVYLIKAVIWTIGGIALYIAIKKVT